jgi:hypothetical protein
MRNLIIIGNGFDLAHGLKTSYNDFIRDLFDNYFKDRNSYQNIFNSCPDIIDSYNTLKFHIKNYPSLDLKTRNKSYRTGDPVFKNNFIELLLYNSIDYNWCDIEYKYFEELKRCKEFGLDPKILNDDFEIVKKYLSMYLIEEEKNIRKLNSYEILFKTFATSEDTMILNFNYTRTIENLYKDVIRCPIIHIHGELENENNPIIFGYAANHNDSRELLSQNNNEYMKNIKKLLYKRTNNENIVTTYLTMQKSKASDWNKINISLLGHSCGLSDNLILNEIFNHKDIYAIRTYYYEDYERYFDIQANIDRIMADDGKFKNLIISFQDSSRMPQDNDNETQIQNFKQYILDVRKNEVQAPNMETYFA